MLSEERRRAILDLLDTKGTVSVAELGSRFDVSEMTVRRDLDDLDNRGLLQRVHGGAVSALGRSYEPAFLKRSSLFQSEKARIGKAAVELINNGDSIALDVGTTTLEIARQLGDKRDLTIITPSLRIANQLAETNGLRLILSGGIIRPGELSMVGEVAEEAFQRFYVDKLFMGVGGIDIEAGLTEYNLEDAAVKKAMLRAAKEIIVVADASKFSRVSFAVIAPINVASRIITDDSVDEAILTELDARGIEITIV
jgi:DeoR/GlpR family transcriptional regulator of sugar metabolism